MDFFIAFLTALGLLVTGLLIAPWFANIFFKYIDWVDNKFKKDLEP